MNETTTAISPSGSSGGNRLQPYYYLYLVKNENIFRMHFDAVVVVVVDYPTLPRDGGIAEKHGALEAGQLPRNWTKGHRETEGCQRVSGAKSP